VGLGLGILNDLAIMVRSLVVNPSDPRLTPAEHTALIWRCGIIILAIAAWLVALIKWRHTRPTALMVATLLFTIVDWGLGLLQVGASNHFSLIIAAASDQWPRAAAIDTTQIMFLCLGLYYVSQFRGVLRALMWFLVVLTGQAAVILIPLTAIGAISVTSRLMLISVIGLDSLAATIAITLGTRRRSLKDLMERNRLLVIERDQRAQLAVAAERNRIAGEMHDIVSHSLAVMVTLADGAGRALPNDVESAREAVSQIGLTGRHAVADMRRLLAFLRSDADLAPQPGLADLERLLNGFREAGLPVTLEIGGPATDATPPPAPQLGSDTWPANSSNQGAGASSPRLSVAGVGLPDDPSLGLAIYRIIQEGLTNVLRHAPGSRWVKVALRRPKPGIIDVRISNGPDPTNSPGVGTGAGQGLLGVKQRVAVWDGTLDSGPTADGGWQLTATLTAPADTAH
jgi:signal transduction histidine kinase